MDSLTSFVELLCDQLPIIADELTEEEWRQFRDKLAALQPKISEGQEPEVRAAAYYDLLDTCNRYPAMRRLLPPEGTMLIEPQSANNADPPRQNRMPDLIKWMDEIKPPVAPKTPADPKPPLTEECK